MKGQKEALAVNLQVKRKALNLEAHPIQAGRLQMKDRKEARIAIGVAVNQLTEKRKAINQEVHHIQEGQHLMRGLKEVLVAKDQQTRSSAGHQKAGLKNAAIIL